MKRLFSIGILLTMIMGFFCVLPPAEASAANINLSVRVEGPVNNIINEPHYNYVNNTTGDYALVSDVLKKVLKSNNITFEAYDKYCYFTKIGKYAEETVNSVYVGWSYAINGVPIENTKTNVTVKNGDKVVLYYGDMRVAVPSYKAGLNDNGSITLTFLYTGVDNEWKYVTNVPLTGATVLWDGKNYTTDNKGNVTIPPIYSSGGNHVLQIQRYTPDVTLKSGEKCANVVRLSPNNKLEITNFTDLTGYEWGKPFIYDLVTKGIINGLNSTTYDPGGFLTRAQVVKMLFQIKGANIYDYRGYSSFADVAIGEWYTPYINWAKNSGVTQGVDAANFSPNGSITREDFASMLKRFGDKEGVNLKPTVKVPVFQDEALIADYAKDAVYALASVEIIKGYEEPKNVFNFHPQSNTTRVEGAKMLSIFQEKKING
ncbi:MAG: S-layer homology domain-containing protein [Clostridiales bacterium]